MKRLTSFLLACVMALTVFSFNAFCADPYEIMPIWDNTSSVVLGHTAIGTTAHCNVDITVDSGSTISNVVIKLISMEGTSRVVKTWRNPTLTLDASNTYNFYGTYSPVVPGNGYRLTFECEVWRSGVCDEISLYKDVRY